MSEFASGYSDPLRGTIYAIYLPTLLPHSKKKLKNFHPVSTLPKSTSSCSLVQIYQDLPIDDAISTPVALRTFRVRRNSIPLH